MITITEYWNLVLTIIVGVGLVFELPVVILLLSIFGIVTPRFLLRHIRYAILITAVVAAALAPTPDWTTLFMFWIPMVGLYVFSIGLSWLVYLKKNRARGHERA
jgi:sec-independent protein translocase protein TatC